MVSRASILNPIRKWGSFNTATLRRSIRIPWWEQSALRVPTSARWSSVIPGKSTPVLVSLCLPTRATGTVWKRGGLRVGPARAWSGLEPLSGHYWSRSGGRQWLYGTHCLDNVFSEYCCTLFGKLLMTDGTQQCRPADYLVIVTEVALCKLMLRVTGNILGINIKY